MKRLFPEIILIILFVSVSLFSVLVAEVYQSAGVQPSSSSAVNLFYVLLLLSLTLVFTAAILYVSRKRGFRLVRGAVLLVSIYATFIVAYAVAAITVSVVPMPSSAVLPVFLFIWFAIPGVLGYFALASRSFIVTDIIGFMLSAGFAAIWGLTLDVWFTVALLVIFAMYDYISVYKTKHMIKLAGLATSGSMNMLFVIPGSRDFDPNSKFEPDTEGKDQAAGTGILLGFGDVALPNVMIISSTIYGNYSLFPYFILPLIGAVAGMLALFILTKKPAPGLPMLNAGVILGFLAALIIH